MRITILTHNYLPYCRAGSEKMLHELAKALSRAGHAVTVLCEYPKKHGLMIDGVPVIYEPRPQNNAAIDVCDVVISQHKLLSSIKRSSAAKVAIFHNDNAKSVADAAYDWDLSICNTRWLQKKLSPKNSIVLHPPVFAEDYPKQSGGEYITLVNLLPEKGSDIFYRLAEKLPKQKFLGVIGGYGKQDIRNLPNVTIQQSTDNMVRDVYSKTKIILMPSSYESYGMVSVEAAHCGIPVICADTEGLREANPLSCFCDDFDGYVEWISMMTGGNSCYANADLADSKQEIKEAVCAIESLMF